MSNAAVRTLGNLPAEMTSFVGRRSELTATRKLLSSTRLLTLTGPGGVGKSRLGVRVATDVHRSFHDGVWLVDLAEINDGTLLPLVIGTAFGLQDASKDPESRLADFVHDKQLLLVLDNCEHVVEATAKLLKNLLTAASGLRVLTTSRHVLSVEGEYVLSVPPLTLPALEERGDRWADESEAVALFVERGAAALSGFSLTEENQDTIAQICRRVDGVPLAIELAAARLRAYSPEQILCRLSQTFQLLAAGPRSAPVRHQTLHDTLKWSYELCSRSEQLLWARLSVFTGGFGLRAVEEVCIGDPIASEHVFDLLGSLVDKSIVTTQREPLSPDARFRMLDTVREYGRERLVEHGEDRELRLRHLDYFKKLAERGSVDYFSPREADWFREVGAERANIRSALELCVTHPEYARDALRIGTALRTYWIAPGFILEGYQWLRKSLALDREPTEARARALWAMSYIEILLGEVETGIRTMDQCKLLADQLDLRDLHTDLTLCASLAEFLRDDLEQALKIAEEGVAAGRAKGDPATTGEALFLATIMAFALNDPRAEMYGTEAVALHDEHGAQLWKAFVLWILGLYWCREDKLGKATVNLHQAIDIFQLLNHNLGLACCLDGLACVAVAAEQPEHAAKLMGAAQTIWRSGPARLPYIYVRKTVVDDAERRTKTSLGQNEFDANFSEGAALPLETALTLAVNRAAKLRVSSAAEPRSRRRGTESTNLTRRESEIADLVAQGMRNKQIAESLVISPRTVDAHVEHILVKLGFHSRAQIANWVARRKTARPAVGE